MSCDSNRSVNVMFLGVAGAPELVEWAERIKKWFRPTSYAERNREVSVGSYEDRVVLRMQRVIKEAGDFSEGLRSPAMESMSLEQALSCLREELTPGGALRFRVFVTGQPKPLKPAIQEQIYLIGREALINALRHSEATSIEAEIEYLPHELRVLVRDNGCGIDPELVTNGRHAYWGLVNMRERAAGIGAQFRVWSRLGAGTEVEFSLPGSALAEAYA